MGKYKHLSLEEREKLYALKSQGISKREIGRILGRSDVTIGRELKRNKTGLGKRSNEYLIFRYVPCKAHAKALKRGIKQRTKAPLKETLIWLYVREHLRKPFHWTPEQISGRLPKLHPGKSICTEAVYQYIYSKQGRKYKLWKLLPHARKTRMKKGGRRVQRASKIPNAVSIEQRPEIVSLRTEVGHWETDNVIGKQTDKTALSVTVERLTRLTLLSLTSRSADSKAKSLIKRLTEFPDIARGTLTTDNGAENTNHQEIAHKLGIAVFFCHSYASWEKGTVENTNGRIRRYIPKGVSLDNLTKNQIKELEYRLNSTPRKCLGFLTPYERMMEVLT
ncbi:IS30 family transposase [Candidatus Daviesbacteria bacterium]|nr:IS30 family transposase [Candidatus Daviesbacteria bacterium]